MYLPYLLQHILVYHRPLLLYKLQYDASGLTPSINISGGLVLTGGTLDVTVFKASSVDTVYLYSSVTSGVECDDLIPCTSTKVLGTSAHKWAACCINEVVASTIKLDEIRFIGTDYPQIHMNASTELRVWLVNNQHFSYYSGALREFLRLETDGNLYIRNYSTSLGKIVDFILILVKTLT